MLSIEELEALQVRREIQSRDCSIAKAIERDEKAIKAQRPSMLEKVTLKMMLEEVAESIKDQALKTKYRGSSVETSAFAKSNVNRVKPASLAIASIRVMWTLASVRGKPCSVLRMVLKLGERFRDILEVEQAIATLGEKDERGVAAMVKAKTSTSEWNDKSLVRHGAIMLQALVDTQLVEFSKLTNGDKRDHLKRMVTLSPKATQIMEELYGSDDLAGLLSIHHPPMVCPPRPWQSNDTGAYLTPELNSDVYFIRPKSSGGRVVRPAFPVNYPARDAINALQAVPLRINADAMALRKFVWDCDIYIHGHTPLRHKLELEEIPADIDEWEVNDKRDFWSRYNMQKRINKSLLSGIAPWLQTTEQARELAALGLPFYLPHNLDYRGRAYPIPSFSHHNRDATKALFEFHNGVPLGEQGLRWLKIHVANSGDFGKISKESLQARVDWCDDNREALEAMVADWKKERLWAEADAPFSFFAAACDLVRAWNSPDPHAYVSHIPVAVDGSNSGIQHYSGLLRAPEGRYVGLTPTDKPADLYAVVAKACSDSISLNNKLRGKSRSELCSEMSKIMDVVREYRIEVEKLIADGEKEQAKAIKSQIEELNLDAMAYAQALWELEGVTRSTDKRPVMTYAYSASSFGFAEQINTDYMAPLAVSVATGAIAEHPFGRERKTCARFLGGAVFKSTQEILPLVTEAMQWLRLVAGACASEGKPVQYTTPTGLVCSFHKQVERSVSLRVKLLGIPDTDEISLRLNMPHNKREYDSTAMKNSIAPNVIHSCDGAHLAMTVNGCHEAGVTDMLCIHDSFATHAGNVPLLVDVLRSKFVELYEGWSPLEDIYEYTQRTLKEPDRVPKPPEKGSLNIRDVLVSDYLFS